MDGRLEEIRKIELQESKLINSPEPARVVLKAESLKRFMSPTFIEIIDPLGVAGEARVEPGHS